MLRATFDERNVRDANVAEAAVVEASWASFENRSPTGPRLLAAWRLAAELHTRGSNVAGGSVEGFESPTGGAAWPPGR